MPKIVDHSIQRDHVRAKLAPRREPYWRQIAPGRFLGFRKTEAGSETWIARWQRTTNALGPVVDFTYTQALAAAEQWFSECEQGVVRAPTVWEACEAYLANVGAMKREESAKDIRDSLRRYLADHPIGAKKLDKLTALDVEKWRDGLQSPTRSPQTINRALAQFKAALNYAFKRRLVSSDHAWKVVEKLPAEYRRRELILTRDQRQALLAASYPELRDYLTALLYTAARP